LLENKILKFKIFSKIDLLSHIVEFNFIEIYLLMKSDKNLNKKKLTLENAVLYMMKFKGTGKSTHSEILKRFPFAIHKIDFSNQRVKYGKTKFNERDYIIIAAEEIVDQLHQCDWELSFKNDSICLYNGSHWKSLSQNEVIHFLGKSSEKLGINHGITKYYQFRERLVKQVKSLALMNLTDDMSDITLINLKNGTLEISPETINFREFRKADNLFYQLDYNYDPKATAPIFFKFLNKVLPDKDMQMILAEYIGYVFLNQKAFTLDKVLFLIGKGANGKSVIFRIVIKLLGKSNVSCFSLEELTDSTGYYRAEIEDKLLNYCSDTSKRLSSAIFKQLVSGEPVSARAIYGRPTKLQHFAKLMFNSNEIPNIDHTYASTRRILVLPMDVKIPKQEQDEKLADKITATELPGILNWALEGLKRLLKNRQFTESKVMDDFINDMGMQADNVKQFLDETGYIISPDNTVLIRDLYVEYRGFCNESGQKPFIKHIFIQRLKDNEIPVERKNIGYVAYLKKKK
jgi:putative DNA primase/helicase